ncbi:hypothetical protein [Pigmentiphaga litoralis]|uniref:hypothetical protein n=1 Tax=Pigmentiphaga litoralis TaxID=516702 RepID=UPI003B42FD78
MFRLPGRSWAVPQPSAEFADGLDAWIATIIAGVARVIEPKPRANVVVSPEQAFAVAQAGDVLGTHGRSMWARVHGSSRLLGLETVSPGLVPLTASHWLVLDAGAPIETLSWQDGLAGDDWHERLDVFHEAIVELLPLVRGLGEADEFNRLTARRAAERHAEHDTAGRFAGVLGNPLPQRRGQRRTAPGRHAPDRQDTGYGHRGARACPAGAGGPSRNGAGNRASVKDPPAARAAEERLVASGWRRLSGRTTDRRARGPAVPGRPLR